MKGHFILLLLFFSPLALVSQNNIAIFHTGKGTISAAGTVGKAVAVAPFDLVNGMVIVKATLDGVAGDYILDTGSPGIVINTTEHKQGSAYSAMGIGGSVRIGETRIGNFSWGIVELKDVEGFTIDLRHLEKATGRKLAGLIGHAALQHYELFFDYPNGALRVYDAANAKEFRQQGASIEISFEMMGHVPMIEVGIGGEKLSLGLDSGAEVNLLDQGYLGKIEDRLLRFKEKETVTGLDKKSRKAVVGVLDGTTLDDHQLPAMKFLFMNLDGLSGQFEERFDGLLGFPFFQQHAVSINYAERKVYVWQK